MTEASKEKYKDFPYSDVKLQDSCRVHGLDLELKYLKSLEPDRLMAGFYETAGLKARAKRYGGWEVTEIQGHTLGHYLTALAQAYAYTKEEELWERICYIIKELSRCQRADGYLFASGEEIFDRVEQKKPAWVPWYTMHKIVSGLLAVYRHTRLEGAKNMAAGLGEWIWNRCMGWKQEVQKNVLSVEYGGMNECLYELYQITKDSRFADAAHRFDEIPLFEKLYQGKDVLNGLHANTTIPKILGALRRYRCMGEECYLKTAEKFWDMVVMHHSYITGGNSEWEHFGKPDILDAERTACNCETCNTYNMLKLSKGLFEITGERKYADYYANTVLNAILSSQNPETGMTTYFQPMETGYFKVYGTPFDSFWCCTGSGMENFTKLTEGIAFRNKEQMAVIQYEDCELYWREKKLRLQMRCTEAKGVFRACAEILEKPETTAELRLLIPRWSCGSVKVQAAAMNAVQEKDWIVLHIDKEIPKGTCAELEFVMALQCHELPDNPYTAAFTYGPYVLSAGLGSEAMETEFTGVNVAVPKKEMLVENNLIFHEKEVEAFKENPGAYFKQQGEEAVFLLENQGKRLVFSPHYLKYRERYGIYWGIYEEHSKKLQALRTAAQRRYRLEKEQLDVIPVGNDQYELAHRIRGAVTDSDYVEGHSCRFCNEGGWFSYEMNPQGSSAVLCMTLARADAGSVFEVYFGDYAPVEIQVQESEKEFYQEELEIPGEAVLGNNTVCVKFQYKKGVCRIFDELYLRKKGEQQRKER